MASLPLAGVRVLDPTAGMVGPYTTMFLSDLGADVIKLEPPEGESGRSRTGFRVWNRGKRSVVIDPATADFADTFSRLLATCDVLVNDCRTVFPIPSYASLAAKHPSLVYLSLPPYGRDNPYEDWPADEWLLQALTGVMGTQAAERSGPVFMVHQVVSSYAAMLAAGFVAEALYVRERTGQGQEVTLPMVSASACVAISLRAEQFQRPMGKRNPSGGQPAYRLYQASDGWLVIACTNPLFWNRLCIAIGAPELVADPRYENAPWGVLPEHQPGLVERIGGILAQKTRDEWLEIFTANDVPAAPVLARDQYLDSDLVLANGLRATVQDPEVGEVTQMGVPLRVDGLPRGVSGPAPRSGEHTEAVMSELAGAAMSPARRPGQAKIARPLEGIRVMDFTTYLGGPYAGMLLADAGADVIKVEPPNGEGFRSGGISGMGFNMGKRGLAIDVQTDRGREVLGDLLGKMDVILEGFRPGVTKRMGMDYQTNSARNPKVVHCNLSGFGHDMALQASPSFDPILQARSGQSTTQGGLGSAPVMAGIAMNDFSAGFLIHYGILSGLYRRERTGKGCYVEVTQAGAALALESEEVTRFKGAPVAGMGGPDFVGPSASFRLYEAADQGWVFLGIRSQADWERFIGVAPVSQVVAGMGPEALHEPAEGRLADELAAMFRSKSRDEWAELGIRTRAPLAPAMDTERDGVDLPIFTANGMLADYSHPTFGPMRGRGQIVWNSAFGGQKFMPPPWIGEHNEAVLMDFGYNRATVEELKGAGVLSAPTFRLY